MHDPAAARAAYERWHAAVASSEAVADAPWHVLLLRHLNTRDIAGRAVLEIGCGRGELSHRLMQEVPAPATLLAADFSAFAVGFARANHPAAPGLHYAVADMQRIPAADARFDTAISCETIEHVPDPLQALREVCRVLRPGGRLFLTTPNYAGPFGVYRAYLRLRGRRYTEGDQPICHFTTLPRTLAWVRRAGFRVVTLDAVGHYLLRPGHLPRRVLQRQERWLWPFGLHSIVVAERR